MYTKPEAIKYINLILFAANIKRNERNKTKLIIRKRLINILKCYLDNKNRGKIKYVNQSSNKKFD